MLNFVYQSTGANVTNEYLSTSSYYSRETRYLPEANPVHTTEGFCWSVNLEMILNFEFQRFTEVTRKTLMIPKV